MTKKNLIITAVVMLCSVSMASAATLSYSTSFGPDAVTSVGYNKPLPQFNPALGTLDSVTIELYVLNSGSSLLWDNESLIPTAVTLSIGATVTATAPSTLVVVAVPLQTGGPTGVTADEIPDDGAGDFAGPDYFGIFGGTGNDTQSNQLLINLGPYIGTGNFNTWIESVANVIIETTGGESGAISSDAGDFEGTIEVTYDYTVPEPATMSLLAVGSLAMLKRRRRKIA